MRHFPYCASPRDFTLAVGGLLIDSEAVSPALQGVRRVEDAQKILDLFAQASTFDPPDWYRPDRPGDRYLMTLMSGEVLAWARLSAEEPLELMAWSDAFQGTIIWRERGPRLVDTSR
ncbi:hypothetical protein [uncultured Methylobacterium sp.]|uniref:hypothetical protein n=1 Tax=uncultured Methylobacterium sp. TaxID=157278 RepID=UPI0035C99463